MNRNWRYCYVQIQLSKRKGVVMKTLAVAACLFGSSTVISAKTRKDIATAPLPAVVVNAKRVFLVNGGGSNLGYDAFYSAMKDWGKYEIVGSPEEADLIVELAYRTEHGGTRVWSTTNTSTRTT